MYFDSTCVRQKKQLGDLYKNKNFRRKSISSIATFCEDDCNKG